MNYGACATLSANKIVTAEENKRKLVIHNLAGKWINKVQVDGCLAIPGKRCDYLFEISDQPPPCKMNKVIYLELKGCDIEKAYQQLMATIDWFKATHQSVSKECHIVASRVPRAGTKVQQLKVQMKKATQVDLIVNTGIAEIRLI